MNRADFKKMLEPDSGGPVVLPYGYHERARALKLEINSASTPDSRRVKARAELEELRKSKG
jgi:hypothetical protein